MRAAHWTPLYPSTWVMNQLFTYGLRPTRDGLSSDNRINMRDGLPAHLPSPLACPEAVCLPMLESTASLEQTKQTKGGERCLIETTWDVESVSSPVSANYSRKSSLVFV